MEITYGTDPEFFAVRAGEFVPAQEVMPDNHLRYKTEFGILYVDGFSLEMQPNHSTSKQEVVENLKQLTNIANGFALDEIVTTPVIEIDLGWLDKYRYLGRFGCEPDESAWERTTTPDSIDATTHPYRYAGGHIHLGILERPFYFENPRNIIEMSRALDRTVGLFSMIVGNGTDIQRKNTYGKLGIYRHQDMRMEYRTPSNLIMPFLEYVYTLAEKTFEIVLAGGYPDICEIIPDEVLTVLWNSNNLNAAKTAFEVIKAAMSLPNSEGI